jgi:predicted DNA binding CopG/RHH family protein
MPKQKQKRNYKRLGTVEFSEEEDKRITKMIEQAEKELEETRVSFRWGKDQLKIVRQAADMMGIPYQTFLKLAAYEHALAILKDGQPLVKRTFEAA